MSTFCIVWLCAMIGFLIVEAIVPGLVSIWFAAGSLVALALAFCGTPLWLQAVSFVVVSLVTLILTRPLAKKYVNSRVQKTNADAVLDQQGLVTERIDNLRNTGAVRAGGKIWSAVSADGSVIEPGTLVRAQEIRGVKLYVTSIEKGE